MLNKNYLMKKSKKNPKQKPPKRFTFVLYAEIGESSLKKLY